MKCIHSIIQSILDILFQIFYLISSFFTWQILLLCIFLFIRKPIFKILEIIPSKIKSFRFNDFEILFNNEEFSEQFNNFIGNKSRGHEKTETKKSILWVDDNPNNNALLVGYLKSKGEYVLQVINTKSALNEISKKHFDIIISDMHREHDGRDAGIKFFEMEDIRMLNADKYIYCGNYNKNKYKHKESELGFKITSSGSELINYIYQ